MQAPKNGFFYVIDRTNGKFISAKPYTYINWAVGMSPEGRPIESEIANMIDMNRETFPTFDGGHNWHPMAFNRKNGLVYIPARFSSTLYGFDSSWRYNTVKDFGSGTGCNAAREPNPSLKNKFDTNAPAKHPQGFLLGWDPVKQKEVWRGLVFQGTADGNLSAYDGDNGKLLWQVNVGTGVIAPPISYLVDGVQYISFQVGWGGSYVALTVNRKYYSEYLSGTYLHI